MGMNRSCIGKVYPPTTVEITAEKTRAYASAYNDDNPAFHDESRPGGIVAPPMFHVVPPAMAIGAVFFDPELNVDFGRLLHGEQDMTFFAPIRPGDTITSTARVPDIIEKSTGEILLVEIESKNQAGELVSRQLMTFFVRGKQKGEGAKKETPPAPPPDRGTPLFVGTSTVKPDQTEAYAEASLDRNPIHLDDDFAKSVGLPGRINHGLCTMAMASKVVIDGCLGGDPLRLKRFKLRFKKPVLLGQTLTTKVWEKEKTGGKTILAFETFDQSGEPVLVEGIAEVAS